MVPQARSGLRKQSPRHGTNDHRSINGASDDLIELTGLALKRESKEFDCARVCVLAVKSHGLPSVLGNEIVPVEMLVENIRDGLQDVEFTLHAKILQGRDEATVTGEVELNQLVAFSL